ncbi:MAG: Phenylpropionate dioxygenase, large terminal subunit [Ilumatobacteraceae bacterium]|nr:Phenylpropionate dioxygenase, large terminal subunit [Ilumatobacteraceae bacterium]
MERGPTMTDITEINAEDERSERSLALGELTSTAINDLNGGLPSGLPMPRNLAMVTDPTQRKLVTHFKGRRVPFPVPNGWFVVAESKDLEPGGVRALFYFDRDLVLYRGEDGVARVMDAHCTHLGAHLAVGGRVDANCLRCPFHGWAFDGSSGRCVDVPYGDTKHIPPKAHNRSYPTIERNHMIWAWYHAHDGEPFYDVPEVDEFSDDEWSPILCRDFVVNVAAQEMAENNVDFAHFRYVHGTDAIPENDFIVDGTYKRTTSLDGAFVREGYGLGLGVLRVKGYVTFLSSTTPIDESKVHVRWIFTAPKANGDGAAEQAADAFLSGVSQDIPIWENKIYRDPPIITKTEKLILEHRRWSLQFYSDFD